MYIIPSNLILQVGVIQKYNNNLVIVKDSTEIVKNEDISPLDSAAVKPVDSATSLDSAPEEHSTRISPAEIGAGIAFVVFILFLTLSS